MNYREAAGIQLGWIDVKETSGFSNFLYIDHHYGALPTMRRIFSLARKFGVQSIAIEDLGRSESSWLQADNAAIAILRNDYQGTIVHRITFWRSENDVQPTPRDFIGYLIFRYDQFSDQSFNCAYIYESVFPSFRKRDWNNFLHSQNTYEVNTPGGRFSVIGNLYAQQNGLTFVCAHVGLRTALAPFLDGHDIQYGTMNDWIGIDHISQKAVNGVSGSQMQTVIQNCGVQFEISAALSNGEHTEPDFIEFQRDLYGAIESGGPALVSFKTHESAIMHVIPVIGHTFNEDTWVADAYRGYFGGGAAAYISSETWVSSFVIHDDNFGPYHCLPRYYLAESKGAYAFCLHEHAAAMKASEIERLALLPLNFIVSEYPGYGNAWYHRFALFQLNRRLVLRTFICSKEQYIQHLVTISDRDGQTVEQKIIDQAKIVLPETFWISEVSAQELFASSRRKLGEVLQYIDRDVTSLPSDFGNVVLVRLPDIFLVPDDLGKSDLFPTALSGHTPLLTYPEPGQT